MGRLEKAMRRAAVDQAAPAGAADLPLPANVGVEDLPNETLEPQSPPAPPPQVKAAMSLDRAMDLVSESPSVPSEEPARLAVAPSAAETELRRQVNAALATKTVVDETMMPGSREQYRRLAAALHQAQRTSGFKVVMVASAVAGEGKTLTASNLAMTLSESYRRDVLLVDADLRRPSLHTIFQLPGVPGLSESLGTAEDPTLPLHRVSERLAVLPAGQPTSDPIGALTSDRMRRMVDEAREVFDWVVIDTPPVGLLTDAALLSSMADGIVLVVKAESTSFEMVQRAVDAIGRDRVIGTVLNRAKEQFGRSSYDYYKYYTTSEPGGLVPAK